MLDKTHAKDKSSSRIKVAVRVRPLSTQELETHASSSSVHTSDTSLTWGDKTFNYDHVFPQSACQKDLYETLAPELLQDFFDGFNVTVMAYGQTGSGKTYTMGSAFRADSPESSDDSPSTPTMDSQIKASSMDGLTPRMLTSIFAHMEANENVSLEISYLEILNEEIKDLLLTSRASSASSVPIKIPVGGLAIRDDPVKGITVTGLTSIPMTSRVQVSEAVSRGNLARATASTSMNATSSRSHAILTLVMTQVMPPHQDGSTATSASPVLTSKLHLVDLAGSERAKKTQASGARFKEGVHINKGLLSLSNVIRALATSSSSSPCENTRPSSNAPATATSMTSSTASTTFIPYRDSKLTRLLSDALGGNSRTLLIACVSPSPLNRDESVNTCRYAARARHITNTAAINVVTTSVADVALLKQQIVSLTQTVLTLTAASKTTGQESCRPNKSMMATQIRRLETSLWQAESTIERHYGHTVTRQMMLTRCRDAENETIRQEALTALLTFEDTVQAATTVLVTTSASINDSLESSGSSRDSFFNTSSSSLDLSFDNHSIIEDDSGDEMTLSVSRTEAKALATLTETIESKEALLVAYADAATNAANLTTLTTQFKTKIVGLEATIQRLEDAKRAGLRASSLTPSTSASTAAANLARLKVLSGQLMAARVELKATAAQHRDGQAKQRAAASAAQHVTTLTNQVSELKRQKTALARDSRASNEQARKSARAQALTITRLKRQEERKGYQLDKLHAQFVKQKSVLKRKTEEVTAASKRRRHHPSSSSSHRSSSGSNSGSITTAPSVTPSSAHLFLTRQVQTLTVAKTKAESSVSTLTTQMAQLVEKNKVMSELLATLNAATAPKVSPPIVSGRPGLPSKKKLKTIYLKDDLEVSESSCSDADSDYVNTPQKTIRRRNRARQTLNISHDLTYGTGTEDTVSPLSASTTPGTVTITAITSSTSCCDCLGKCFTKACGCRKEGQSCGVGCGCDVSKCKNGKMMTANACATLPAPVPFTAMDVADKENNPCVTLESSCAVLNNGTKSDPMDFTLSLVDPVKEMKSSGAATPLRKGLSTVDLNRLPHPRVSREEPLKVNVSTLMDVEKKKTLWRGPSVAADIVEGYSR